MEVVGFELVYFSCVVLQFNDYSAYPLVFPSPHILLTFVVPPETKIMYSM